jgi:hypothetical protein
MSVKREIFITYSFLDLTGYGPHRFHLAMIMLQLEKHTHQAAPKASSAYSISFGIDQITIP